jgi:hypothetical protein
MIPPCRECQWVVGEPKGERTVFCSEPVIALGKSFCWEHHFRAYRRSFVPLCRGVEEENNDAGQAD